MLRLILVPPVIPLRSSGISLGRPVCLVASLCHFNQTSDVRTRITRSPAGTRKERSRSARKAVLVLFCLSVHLLQCVHDSFLVGGGIHKSLVLSSGFSFWLLALHLLVKFFPSLSLRFRFSLSWRVPRPRIARGTCADFFSSSNISWLCRRKLLLLLCPNSSALFHFPRPACCRFVLLSSVRQVF